MRLIALGLAELQTVKSKTGESNMKREVDGQKNARERGATLHREGQRSSLLAARPVLIGGCGALPVVAHGRACRLRTRARSLVGLVCPHFSRIHALPSSALLYSFVRHCIEPHVEKRPDQHLNSFT